jgi:hypothetical protein
VGEGNQSEVLSNTGSGRRGAEQREKHRNGKEIQIIWNEDRKEEINVRKDGIKENDEIKKKK